jgi:hypothetical protein
MALWLPISAQKKKTMSPEKKSTTRHDSYVFALTDGGYRLTTRSLTFRMRPKRGSTQVFPRVTNNSYAKSGLCVALIGSQNNTSQRNK